MDGKRYRYRRTLIVEEVGSGKTAYTLQIFRRERIYQILRTPRASGVNVLFINDISLYFHAGHADHLWLQVEGVPILIMATMEGISGKARRPEGTFRNGVPDGPV